MSNRKGSQLGLLSSLVIRPCPLPVSLRDFGCIVYGSKHPNDKQGRLAIKYLARRRAFPRWSPIRRGRFTALRAGSSPNNGNWTAQGNLE